MKNRIIVMIITFFIVNSTVWAQENGVMTIDLEYAKTLAEANSRELEIQRIQLGAQRYAYDLGIRSFFPQLSIGVSQNDTINYNAPDSTSKTVSLTLSQPLFDGGRSLFQRKVQKLSLSLDQYSFIKKREELLDQTWKLFYKIILSQEKSKIQNELYKIAQDQLLISRTEFEVGVITSIELVDTEIEVKRLEIEMQQTHMQEETLFYQFTRLLGLPQETHIRLSHSFNSDYSGLPLIDDIQHWYRIGLELNADLKQLQFEAAKSREELKIAQQTFIPTITADISLTVSGDRFPLQNPGLSAKLRFAFPFQESPTNVDVSGGVTGVQQRTSGGSFQTNVLPNLNFLADKKLALLKLRSMNVQIDDAFESLRFNIEQFLKQYRFAQTELKLRKENIKLLDRKQEVYKQQLGIGEIKRIDYLKAEIEFFKEKIALRERIVSLMQMERTFEQMLGFEPGGLANYIQSNSETSQKGD